MKTVMWLIILAVFVFSAFIFASQQGHAYIANTFFFEHKTILTFISATGMIFSFVMLVKSALK